MNFDETIFNFFGAPGRALNIPCILHKYVIHNEVLMSNGDVSDKKKLILHQKKRSKQLVKNVKRVRARVRIMRFFSSTSSKMRFGENEFETRV